MNTALRRTYISRCSYLIKRIAFGCWDRHLFISIVRKPLSIATGDGEEEAFPQTPSSLKSAVWGSKLWPAQSPASLAPAGATSSMQPFDGAASLLAAAAHPAITPDTGAPDTDVANAAAAEKGQKAAAGGKPEKSAFNVSASCVRAQQAAPAAPNKVMPAAAPKTYHSVLPA